MMNPMITGRLEIRRFRQSDKEQYAKIITNPAVYQYLGNRAGVDEETAKKMVTFFAFSLGVFAVVERASGKLIGHCGIRPIQDGRIELLYAYDPSAWGKGYGTEAAIAVIEYGKENFEIDKLIAMAYAENPGSIGIMKKLGFTSIGQEEHFGNMLEMYMLAVK